MRLCVLETGSLVLRYMECWSDRVWCLGDSKSSNPRVPRVPQEFHRSSICHMLCEGSYVKCGVNKGVKVEVVFTSRLVTQPRFIVSYISSTTSLAHHHESKGGLQCTRRGT